MEIYGFYNGEKKSLTQLAAENGVSYDTLLARYKAGVPFGELVQKKQASAEVAKAVFIPSVDTAGNISWTNDAGLDNPPTSNIRGPQGIQGPQGEKGDKGEKGNPGSSGSPHNLLDNSDFRNPVNQRGKNSYAVMGYAIDRWALQNQDGTVFVQNGYLSLRAETRQFWLTQFFENHIPIGTKVTAAICDTTNNIYVITAEIAEIGIGHYIAEKNANIWFASNEFCFVPDGGSTLDIKWAALYEGEYTSETLPEYQPKGYAAELMECMRYYQRSYVSTPVDAGTNACVYHVAASAYGAGTHLFPVEMRITPTVTLYAPATGASGYVSRWSTDGNVAALTNRTTKGFQVRSNAGDFVRGEVYVCHYEASADL